MADHPNGNGDRLEIIPALPDDKLTYPRLLAPYERVNGVITSIDVGKVENRAAYMRMARGEATRLSKMHGQRLEVVHLLIEPVRLKAREGRPEALVPRLVLLCADGRLYQSCSYTVLKSLADLVMFRPQLPWDPPEVVEVEFRPLDGGGFVYNLYSVVDPPPAQPKKGGK